MVQWFWIFLIYSFGGFLLETWFARATHAANQSRRCLVFLPLCPVYGLALAAVLALPESWRTGPALLLTGAVVTTAVEYAYHWACQTFLRVKFWDYSGVWGNVRGRICLPFTLAWGLLTAAALWMLQPTVEWLISRIPPAVTFVSMLIVTADGICTVRYLALTHDPVRMGPGKLRRA